MLPVERITSLYRVVKMLHCEEIEAVLNQIPTVIADRSAY